MPHPITLSETELPLSIIYQDDHLVAINKPSGLLVHRSLIDRHETQFAMQLTRDQVGKKVYTVHRLDKPTSGVLLFALDTDTARLLSEQFATHQQVQKTYHAVSRGFVNDADTIDYPLQEKPDKIVDKKARKNKRPQPAVTSYRCLQRYEIPSSFEQYEYSRYSLLELKPQTGRKHQLRRHMKHIFHPIIGDSSYGDGKHNHFFREQFNNQRLLLHAARISLSHPVTNDPLSIEAPMPSELKHLVMSLDDYTYDRPTHADNPSS